MEEEMTKKECQFMVSIRGENTHFDVPLCSLDDLENLENILKTIRRKLR